MTDLISDLEYFLKLRFWRDTNISAKTKKQYLAAYQRMGHRNPLQMGTIKKSSYYYYRAAYIHGKLEELYQAYIDNDQQMTITAGMRPILRALHQFKPDPNRRHLQAGIRSELTNAQPARSKGQALRTLPGDWQAKMFAGTRSTELQSYLATMTLTGCRPAELELGILWKIMPSGNLAALVRGAKVKQQTGQPQRTIVVSCVTQEADLLAQMVRQSSGVLQVICKAKRLGKAVARLAQRVFPKKRVENRPSPYVYRHAFADSIRSADAETIAMALGQSATETAWHYGGKRPKARDIGFREAKASRKPRTSPHRGRYSRRAASPQPSLPTP